MDEIEEAETKPCSNITLQDLETEADAGGLASDAKVGETIRIGQKTFTMGRSTKIDGELIELKQIVDRESGHWQLLK